MTFEPIDFQQLSEADIRGEVIDYLLRRLGYRSSTTNNIIREQPLSLRYPKAFLGRKNSNKDPLLRGKADYICEVEGRIRWVIEAKPPTAEISLDDIEQAYTYANHPEIRAVLFCVCNGRELKAYQTNLGADAAPLLCVPYSEFNERFDELENLLSPAAIHREFPIHIIDVGKPLGLGLRSIVRITGGRIEYNQNNWNLPALRNITLAITGGSIERDENRQMVATVKTLSPFASLQKLNEKIGMQDIEAHSNDGFISNDRSNPTKFLSSSHVIFPKGEKVLNLSTWKEDTLPVNIVCLTETVAEVALVNNVLTGAFRLKIATSVDINPLEAIGKFEVYVA